MDILKAEQFILDKLKRDLPSNLFYHGYHHTLDVYHATKRLAELEQVRGSDLALLKTAALYHDSGFTTRYKNHEEAGCDIARDTLPAFGYNEKQIERICGMIMATKLPQTPTNHLEQILADADLDYLGRPDFYPIAQTLYEEFLAYGIIKDEQEWNRLQLRFFENHTYFTNTAQHLRDAQKKARLEEIRKIVAGYETETA
jgi:predicted metal-dependent HD superfamily phosphohydrolase